MIAINQRSVLFASDIDDTLIHSWRKRIDADICVEYRENRPQGFIASSLREILASTREKMDLLPVTTRSVEQYQRIQWEMIFPVRHAIVSNGGVILGDTVLNKKWQTVILSSIKRALPVYSNIADALSRDGVSCRVTDGVLLRIPARHVPSDRLDALLQSHGEVLYRFTNGNTHYLCPVGISKGLAVAFYLKKQSYDLVLSAGDSDVDVSMLHIADTPIVPESLVAKLSNTAIPRVWSGGDFGSYIADVLREVIYADINACTAAEAK